MANVSYLMRALPQGEQKKMAAEIGVAEETVSRWAKGKVPPNSGNVKDILRYLRIQYVPDFSEAPLFLSLQPVGQYAQRDWLKKRLEALPAQELGRLFPALEKLLGEHEGR
jgi:transcriptional regulator with XRE-family HTH domain